MDVVPVEFISARCGRSSLLATAMIQFSCGMSDLWTFNEKSDFLFQLCFVSKKCQYSCLTSS